MSRPNRETYGMTSIEDFANWGILPETVQNWVELINLAVKRLLLGSGLFPHWAIELRPRYRAPPSCDGQLLVSDGLHPNRDR